MSRFPSAVHGLLSIVRHLPKYLRLSWRLMRDPRVPRLPKAFVVAVIAYGVLPLDLLPEALVPHFGYAEDILLFLVAIRNLVWGSPPHVVTEHARQIALDLGRGQRDVDQKG